MKKFIIIVAVILSQISMAQPVLRIVTIEQSLEEDFERLNGDYIKDTNNLMEKYIGIWKYEGNGMTYVLNIRKATQFLSTTENGKYDFMDKLFVTYKFIKDGVTLVDNLNEPMVSSFSNGNGIKYGRYWFNSLDYLSGFITDIPLNIIADSDIYPITTVRGALTKIKIQYNGLNSLRRNPDAFYIGKPTFLIPNFVELIRQ
jgi:hypothetical protein